MGLAQPRSFGERLQRGLVVNAVADVIRKESA
jgi:hypothetical protein